MTHSNVPYPTIPDGEGIRCLRAILEHMRNMDDLDYTCAVKDGWVITTVIFKIWPGEPNGPVIGQSMPTNESIEAVIAENFGDVQAAKQACCDIVEENATRSGVKMATDLMGFDWVTLLMQLLPIILELIEDWLKNAGPSIS